MFYAQFEPTRLKDYRFITVITWAHTVRKYFTFTSMCRYIIRHIARTDRPIFTKFSMDLLVTLLSPVRVPQTKQGLAVHIFHLEFLKQKMKVILSWLILILTFQYKHISHPWMYSLEKNNYFLHVLNFSDLQTHEIGF